jgi:hypothetical protein
VKRISRGGGRFAASFTARAVGTAVVVAGALALSSALSACSFTNPTTTATTYDAADGVNGEIADDATGVSIQLRNLSLVTTAAQAPGLLIGAIANQGEQPVSVTLTVLDTEGNPVGGGTVEAQAKELVQINGGGSAVRIASMPTDPGTNLQVQVETPSGGQRLTLPVLAAEGRYAALAPSLEGVRSSPRVSPSPSASASPSS